MIKRTKRKIGVKFPDRPSIEQAEAILLLQNTPEEEINYIVDYAKRMGRIKMLYLTNRVERMRIEKTIRKLKREIKDLETYRNCTFYGIDVVREDKLDGITE